MEEITIAYFAHVDLVSMDGFFLKSTTKAINIGKVNAGSAIKIVVYANLMLEKGSNSPVP